MAHDEADELKLYRVAHPSQNLPRLIWAKNKAQAIGHVTKPYEARLATQREIVDLLREGIEEERVV
jgi:hypothetical protein